MKRQMRVQEMRFAANAANKRLYHEYIDIAKNHLKQNWYPNKIIDKTLEQIDTAQARSHKGKTKFYYHCGNPTIRIELQAPSLADVKQTTFMYIS